MQENQSMASTPATIESVLYEDLEPNQVQEVVAYLKSKEIVKLAHLKGQPEAEFSSLLAGIEPAGRRNRVRQLLAPYTDLPGRVSVARNPKRLRDEDVFYFPVSNRRVSNVRWAKPDVLEVTTDSVFYLFSINNFLEPLHNWIHNINNPLLLTQRKSLLLVDGAVKSGKTTTCQWILPFILHDRNILREDFCFAYIDLSELRSMSSINEKWRQINEMFRHAFQEVWEDVDPSEFFHYRVRTALQRLKAYGNLKWIIALDEYHFIFSGLSRADMDTMAEQMKKTLLDNDSPCYFVLAGSTQATFWWSIDQARPNGVNMLTGVSHLTTPFRSTQEDIAVCLDILIAKEKAKAADVVDALDMLELRTVASLCQTVRRLTTGRFNTVVAAYEDFIESKMQVYWRDYSAVPQGITPDYFLEWANGSPSKPSGQFKHLLIQRGKLFYLQDPNFAAFLKAFYSLTTHTLNWQDGVPWADVMLFVPLLPLGQLQKQYQLNEAAFEAACYQLDATIFTQVNYPAFALYLTNHPANPAYNKQQPNNLTWVTIMRMLRNIVAHESSLHWRGISDCLHEVVKYTKTRENFRTLIHTEEVHVVL